jgi:TolB protein
MNTTAFAHTSPVWIQRVGSTDPDAVRAAAAELLAALDVIQPRLDAAYGGAAVPSVRARFEQARAELMRLARR